MRVETVEKAEENRYSPPGSVLYLLKCDSVTVWPALAVSDALPLFESVIVTSTPSENLKISVGINGNRCVALGAGFICTVLDDNPQRDPGNRGIEIGIDGCKHIVAKRLSISDHALYA